MGEANFGNLNGDLLIEGDHLTEGLLTEVRLYYIVSPKSHANVCTIRIKLCYPKSQTTMTDFSLHVK